MLSSGGGGATGVEVSSVRMGEVGLSSAEPVKATEGVADDEELGITEEEEEEEESGAISFTGVFDAVKSVEVA